MGRAVLLLPHTNNALNILEYHNCRFSFHKLQNFMQKHERNPLQTVVISKRPQQTVGNCIAAERTPGETMCGELMKVKKQVSVFGKVFLCVALK